MLASDLRKSFSSHVRIFFGCPTDHVSLLRLVKGLFASYFAYLLFLTTTMHATNKKETINLPFFSLSLITSISINPTMKMKLLLLLILLVVLGCVIQTACALSCPKPHHDNNKSLLIKRSTFLSTIITTVVSTGGCCAKAFDGGVGGLGKTKPETGM